MLRAGVRVIATLVSATLTATIVASSSAAQVTPLQQRIAHEQQYIANCDALKANSDPTDLRTWKIVFFQREEPDFQRQGKDAFLDFNTVRNTLRRLRETHQLTPEQTTAEWQQALALTRQAMGYCRDNRAAVELQLAKDLFLETGAHPDIQGDWYFKGHGDQQDTIVYAPDGTLELTNEVRPTPETARGTWTGWNQITVRWRDNPSDTGTLNADNSVITWLDGRYWTRRPVH
jgi:hypothetical protein